MAGMIGQLRDETGGMRGLGKVEKIYVDNTNLMFALIDIIDLGRVRETFFYNQMRLTGKLVSSKVTGFRIGDRIIEVGGLRIGRKHLEGNPDEIVVRDDIERGYGQFVPLWHFGLRY